MRKRYCTAARLIGALLLAASTLVGAASGVYMEPEQFLAEAFPDTSPAAGALWITGRLREQTSAILAHNPSSARQRYWHAGNRSAWILNEIGKEQPITAGFIVEDGIIQAAYVLTFRESRGWEIRSPGFTRQFDGARLHHETLDREIDGISGATLSVRAMHKMARLALLYHGEMLRNLAANDTP